MPNGSTGSGSSEELVVVLCGASLLTQGWHFHWHCGGLAAESSLRAWFHRWVVGGLIYVGTADLTTCSMTLLLWFHWYCDLAVSEVCGSTVWPRGC